MTTKVLTVFLGIMLICGIGFASPLTDYSAGKVAIDLDWRNTQLDGGYSLDNSTTTVDAPQLNLDKRYSLDGTVTVGLGNKLAFQYNDFRPKGSGSAYVHLIYNGWNLSGNRQLRTKLATQQANILYKVDDNLSVYTGVYRAKGEFEATVGGANLGAEAKQNIWQLGLVASRKLNDQTTFYGIVGLGKDLTNWTAGLSYEIGQNTEVNLTYRKLKVDDLNTGGGGIMNGEARGIGFGVTHKF